MNIALEVAPDVHVLSGIYMYMYISNKRQQVGISRYIIIYMTTPFNSVY